MWVPFYIFAPVQVQKASYMKINSEGYPTLVAYFSFVALCLGSAAWLWPAGLPWLIAAALFGSYYFIQFFRQPERPLKEKLVEGVYSPADGKVVVIEETEEPECFKDKRLKISIFMSAWDVHENRVPIDGSISYYRYHPGRYLVAWHPKSSTDNEHNTIVIKSTAGPSILLRQIAGAVARRIVFYHQEGKQVAQGESLGFIKFGSRMDVFLPLNAELQVKKGEKLKANRDLIALLRPET